MPRRGRRRKKSRTHNETTTGSTKSSSNAIINEGGTSALKSDATNDVVKVPKSLIIRKGKTANEINELVDNMRKLMLPYTALHFHDDPKNRKLTLKQYCNNLALPMGITHIIQFTQKLDKVNMKIARLPEGPVLYFKVHAFTLIKHIQSIQKHPIALNTTSITSNPPIVVTNNFGDHTALPHIKLLRITFQNLFPQINVSTVKLKDCRRVVLFNLIEDEQQEQETIATKTTTNENKDNTKDDDNANDDNNNKSDDENEKTNVTTTTNKKVQYVEMRHYAIKATPVGVNRRVRRLVQSKLPNLNQCQDIADYLTGQAYMSDAPSDSEPEDAVASTVQLSDKYVGKGNNAKQKSALKLIEIGPRLKLQLIKVEKELEGNGSTTLYHARIYKTPQEALELQQKKEYERNLKIQRRAQQDANVEKKRKLVQEKRDAKRKKQQEQNEQNLHTLQQNQQKIEGVSSDSSSSDDDDDDDEE